MRKPGCYWVKPTVKYGWEPARWDGSSWLVVCSDGDPWNDSDMVEIGPRIPTPDEPWQCVPVEPTEEMRQACDHDTPGPFTAWKAWQVMLAAAPTPESQTCS